MLLNLMSSVLLLNPNCDRHSRFNKGTEGLSTLFPPQQFRLNHETAAQFPGFLEKSGNFVLIIS